VVLHVAADDSGSAEIRLHVLDGPPLGHHDFLEGSSPESDIIRTPGVGLAPKDPFISPLGCFYRESRSILDVTPAIQCLGDLRWLGMATKSEPDGRLVSG
jgi:hypothetical protein